MVTRLVATGLPQKQKVLPATITNGGCETVKLQAARLSVGGKGMEAEELGHKRRACSNSTKIATMRRKIRMTIRKHKMNGDVVTNIAMLAIAKTRTMTQMKGTLASPTKQRISDRSREGRRSITRATTLLRKEDTELGNHVRGGARL
jgi:hypothetical protein